MRARARGGSSMAAGSVIEELIFYLCNEEAAAWMELDMGSNESEYEKGRC